MNKATPVLFMLLLANLTGSTQMRWVLNGTSPITFVLNGGTAANPEYIEVNNPASNAITTIGSNAWIVSESEYNMVKWDIGNAIGNYIVPFGAGTTEYLPLTTNIGTAGSAGGSILFSTWHTPADNALNLPSGVTNIAAMYTSPGGQPSNADNSWNAVDRFWVVDPSHAAFAYTTNPALNSINFTYISNAGTPSEVAAPNVFAESNLLAQRFNPAVGKGWGDYLGAGGTDVIFATTGTVSSGAVSPANFFRSWTLANQNSPLPVQINYFTAQCDNGGALIQWTSQTELNNDYYTVKKTIDNVHFETVGTVKGAGTTSLPSYYSIVDNSPFAGVAYYVLEQTDFNGNTTQAGNVSFAGCGTNAVTIINSYNTGNYIEISINSICYDNYDISLINMLGQTVVHENRQVAIGNNEIKLNNSVSPGVYILNIKNGKMNYTKKMIL